MLEKLDGVMKRYEQICAQMDDPAVYSDPSAYAALAREQKELLPLAEAYRHYTQLKQTEQEAKTLLTDPDLKELAQSELAEVRAALPQAEQTLRTLLLPRDPRDQLNVILELRAGTGGEEAALFAADLYRMYALYAERRGWRVEPGYVNATELGGFREISCIVEGEGTWSRLKFEAGTHCVKRIPETESNDRIQTSTATVAVLPEVEEVELSIDPAELKIDTFRSSGAGGQKVNKTETAIRVTHLPTGMVVECQDERSQYKNKDRALKILRARLYEAAQQRQSADVAAVRRSQVGGAARSEKIRTYYFLRGQATDHRLTGEGRSFPLPAVLNGELDPLIDALTAVDQAARLTAADTGGDAI